MAEEDTRVQLFRHFENVRFLVGEDPLISAAAEADRRGPYPLPEKFRRPNKSYPMFLRIAQVLQEILDEGAIKLPVKNTSAILGVSESTVSTLRKWAEKDGFLIEVQRYSIGRKRATRFKFIEPKQSAVSDEGG